MELGILMRIKPMLHFTGILTIDSLLAGAESSRDGHGNTFLYLFLEDTERYLFDFEMDCDRWEQFDTRSDASYFGIWISKKDLRTLTFAEGDLTAVQFVDETAFDRGVAEMCRCYEESPAFTTIDLSKRTVTRHYEDRELHFIDVERGRALLAELGASGS